MVGTGRPRDGGGNGRGRRDPYGRASPETRSRSLTTSHDLRGRGAIGERYAETPGGASPATNRRLRPVRVHAVVRPQQWPPVPLSPSDAAGERVRPSRSVPTQSPSSGLVQRGLDFGGLETAHGIRNTQSVQSCEGRQRLTSSDRPVARSGHHVRRIAVDRDMAGDVTRVPGHGGALHGRQEFLPHPGGLRCRPGSWGRRVVGETEEQHGRGEGARRM
jgi:hypothetical protein